VTNLNIIAGVDEAGRGPLAGPVVSAAVILPKNHAIKGLKDSKKISAKKREVLYDEIIKVSDVGIGIVSHRVIDKINILQATFKSMRKAISNLTHKPEKVLIDGYGLPDLKIKNEGIIGGDNLIDSISAASIIAKVTRDRFMVNIDPIFPEYGFIKHKGYGTKFHMEALKEFKSSPIHRKSFLPVAKNLPTLAWIERKGRIDLLGVQLTCLKYINNGYNILGLKYSLTNSGIIDIILEKNNIIFFIKVQIINNKDSYKVLRKNINIEMQQFLLTTENYIKDNSIIVKTMIETSLVNLGKKPSIRRFKNLDLSEEIFSF